ncbi:MAG: hypothetical protein JW839_12490, partial [Candidatus Lokiarchaeota archaeon]|nr:hypothetical protein [Candidatus Lokiarchaeota archaeon]
MAEEQRPRPPLQEIPNRPLRMLGESADEEGKILALIKSIKENLDVKMLALRKDIDRQTHDEILREVSKIQDAIEKLQSNNEDSHTVLGAKVAGLAESLNEKVDAKLARLKEEVEAKQSDQSSIDIARIQEELEAGRTNGELARAALVARIEGLAVKVDAIASAPAEEVALLKQSVEATLKQVQSLVSSFDLPAFVNEIRQMYSDRLAQAEQKLKAIAEQLARAEEENEQLKKAIGEKELLLKSHTPQPAASRPDASPAAPERAPRAAV